MTKRPTRTKEWFAWTDVELADRQRDLEASATRSRSYAHDGDADRREVDAELHRLARIGLAASKALIGEAPNREVPERLPSVTLRFPSAALADAFLNHPAWWDK